MEYMKVMIDWVKVREAVYVITGKYYSQGYLMGVRSGSHTNKVIYDFLKTNNLLKDGV